MQALPSGPSGPSGPTSNAPSAPNTSSAPSAPPAPRAPTFADLAAPTLPRWVLAAALALGALFALVVLGPDTVWPTNVQWLADGDTAQSWLGWQFFRAEPWGWPLGSMRSLGLEQAASIVYTDSIPLVALPLKLVAGLLPREFQYHGLWVLGCYMANAWLGARLAALLSPRPLFVLAGALLVVLSPIVLQRATVHFALVAHWIPLAALYLFMVAPSRARTRQSFVLLTVATLVHAYLLLMACLFFAAHLLWLSPWMTRRLSWRAVLSRGALALAGVLFCAWAAGYFVALPSAAGFENYSMNLLAPLVPTGAHPFLVPEVETATWGQYEGFNYLGLGVSLTLLAAFGMWLARRLARRAHRARREPGARVRVPWRERSGLALSLACAPLVFLAVTTQPTIGPHILFSLRGDSLFWRAFDVFRASGRMFWPVYYLLVWLALRALAQVPRRYALAALGAVLAVQVADLGPFVLQRHEDLRGVHATRRFEPHPSPFWREARARYDRLYVVPGGKWGQAWLPHVYLAYEYGFAVDNMYYARLPSKEAQAPRLARQERFLVQGVLEPNALYIVQEEARERFGITLRRLPRDTGVGVVDGLTVVAPGWFDAPGRSFLARPEVLAPGPMPRAQPR